MPTKSILVIDEITGVADSINSGEVSVIPTDTVYGLVGKASLVRTVDKIFKIKGRSEDKPLIILISDIAELSLFGVEPTPEVRKLLSKIWPGPVSVIMPCDRKDFEYLHRGLKTLAFRFPDKPELIALLKKTGPLVAPSANPEGSPVATTVEEAIGYFGENICCYVDGGAVKSEPSTLVEYRDGKINILRQGKTVIDLYKNV